VNISNGNGDTTTSFVNSTLGSHLVLGSNNLPTIGGPVVVLNNAGFDTFTSTTTTMPWGLKIDNNNGGSSPGNWGSTTTISQSSIGTSPYGPRVPLIPGPVAGDAMILLGMMAATWSAWI